MKVKMTGDGDTLGDVPLTPGVGRPPGTQSTIQAEDAKSRSLGRALQVKAVQDKERMKPRKISQTMDSGNPRRIASG